MVKNITRRAQMGFVDPQLANHFDFLESELGKSTYFAGDEFSAADVMMSFPLETGALRGGAFEGRPRLKAFVARIHARPAYKTAIEKGGPYVYAK
jgi:glutathione S-transferase